MMDEEDNQSLLPNSKEKLSGVLGQIANHLIELQSMSKDCAMGRSVQCQAQTIRGEIKSKIRSMNKFDLTSIPLETVEKHNGRQKSQGGGQKSVAVLNAVDL